MRGVEGLPVTPRMCLTECSMLNPWERHSRWSCHVSITTQLIQLSDVLGKNSWKGRSDALQGVVCISRKTAWACSVLFVIPPGFPGARKHSASCCQIQLTYSTGKIQALPGPGFEGTVLNHVSVDWLPALLHGHMKEMGVKEETNGFGLFNPFSQWLSSCCSFRNVWSQYLYRCRK